jgi:hypothetical protein
MNWSSLTDTSLTSAIESFYEPEQQTFIGRGGDAPEFHKKGGDSGRGGCGHEPVQNAGLRSEFGAFCGTGDRSK